MGAVTYCLAMRLDEGLVFLADTRTNAGVDNVSTFRKVHVIQPSIDRLFVLQSAGSLATTHELLDRIDRDLRVGGDGPNLATVDSLPEAALYIGRLSREIAASHAEALPGRAATATFILGGQVAGTSADIILIYPEGNYIRASEDRPYLQIGESKYGKFLLDLAANAHASLPVAVRVAVASMMTTARANLSVGPPYDLGIYLPNSLALRQLRIEDDSELLTELEKLWERHMTAALAEMPHIDIDFEPLD